MAISNRNCIGWLPGLFAEVGDIERHDGEAAAKRDKVSQPADSEDTDDYRRASSATIRLGD